jgi:hypothetical protein
VETQVISVEKLQLIGSSKLEQLCVETQVASICGETLATMQQETLAAMRGNPSYICGETPVAICSRKLELLCAKTQVTSICGETPVAMQQET